MTTVLPDTTLDGPDDESGGVQRLERLTLGFLGAAVLASVLAVPVLPGEITIRWTLGGGTYWGPSAVSTGIGLAILPTVAVGTWLAGRWLATVDALARQMDPEDADAYRLALTITVAMLAAAQLLLVGLNLA